VGDPHLQLSLIADPLRQAAERAAGGWTGQEAGAWSFYISARIS
jgi:hypothetical protein